MKIWHIVAFTFLLTTVGCKKGKADFTLKGVLTDSTFGQPLSNASVYLYEIEAGNTTSKLLGQLTTGSDGSYSFTFPRNQAESYNIVSDKSNYFPIDEVVYFSDMTIDEDNVRNFSTTAKAWVKLHFTNQSPAAVTDVLHILKQTGKSGCSECLTSDDINITGIVDTVISCVNDGNASFSYLFNVIGQANSGLKSATTNAFDTTVINLNY